MIEDHLSRITKRQDKDQSKKSGYQVMIIKHLATSIIAWEVEL